MWRSIASRSSFTRSFGRKLISSTQTPPSQVIHKPLISSHFTVIENPGKFCYQNHRFFSHSSSISEIETENHDSTSSEDVELENGGVFDDTHDVSSSQQLGLNPNFDEINDAQMSGIGLNDQGLEGVSEEITGVDVEQLENVLSLLLNDVDGSLESSLDSMDLKLNEEFVVRVLETPLIPGDHLIRFYKWVSSRNEFKGNTLLLSELVRAICNDSEPKRKNVYALWDLVKEMGEKESGVVDAEMLNQLISAFLKLGKGKAAYEAFGKFEEFGCVLNVDSYYLTIEALCKRSFYDWATLVVQKMLDAGMLPESEKVGEIISFLCKGYKSKEAHVVYLAAKRDNKYPSQKAVNFLISCLSKVDETVDLAQETLVDVSDEVRKHAINPFSWVIRGLCRKNDIEGAKKLFAEMMEKGPPPGNAIFNIIINSLSKAGDMEDAKRLLKLMETRGLKPDVYTYSVIISGYAKGGMMEEARKVLSMAKRKHSKLCPATFHSLIRGYCNLGEFDRAMKLLSEMKDSGVEPNVDEYNKFIQSLCLKALDWKSAEKLLEEMKEKGLYLPGITRGLVSAVKELEQEAVGSEDDHAKP
ncbi:pentatricopeptide repeat-containing protein At3g02650, mitochondrial-like [Chenopodium quinoa]|uniref:pentatricopeptide repeat-containing protein At3g02650, mitochondrial-like n=1 Tax=Chenopodium quinoa TaxID=63459 RepID=UPI000B76EA0F|nr:pentatricopeptide repeat-containing protein At3g02650, mitochondrial-like [Chenopodium quinoa]